MPRTSHASLNSRAVMCRSVLLLWITRLSRSLHNLPAPVLFKVYRFVVLVTKAVIPHAFWGDETNFKLICQCTSAHNHSPIQNSYDSIRCQKLHRMSSIRDLFAAPCLTIIQHVCMWMAYASRFRGKAKQGACFGCAQASRTFGGLFVLVLRLLCLATLEGKR